FQVGKAVTLIESTGVCVDGVDTDVHFAAAADPGVVECELQQTAANSGIAQRRANIEFLEMGQWTVAIWGRPEGEHRKAGGLLGRLGQQYQHIVAVQQVTKPLGEVLDSWGLGVEFVVEIPQ